MEMVYLLYHIHNEDMEDEDVKLIGTYSSHLNAEQAVERLIHQPGFRDHPDGFQIHECTLNKDHWMEGFVTVNADGEESD